ncbi:MAG TPA: hypothetical protein VFU86_23220, partial [Terriglobales bacterium]|nr:hypothetical protein [Terriglobales bacterium]
VARLAGHGRRAGIRTTLREQRAFTYHKSSVQPHARMAKLADAADLKSSYKGAVLMHIIEYE